MGEKSGLVRKGRGKPPKNQEILGQMVLAHAPDMAGIAILRSSDVQADPIGDVGIEAKFSRISQIIGLRLGNAVSEAEKLRDSENEDSNGSAGLTGVMGTPRPWLGKKSPVITFSEAERAKHANERVIDTLVSHLIEHIAIEQELASIAGDARRRAEDELRDIPLAMVDFVNRLMASGVIAHDVKDISKRRLSAVIAAIKSIDQSEAEGMVPDSLPRSTWSDAEAGSPKVAIDVDGERSGTGSDGLIDEGNLEVELVSEALAGDAVEPSVSEPVEPVFEAVPDTDPDTDMAATRNDVEAGLGTLNEGVSEPVELVESVSDSDGPGAANDAPVVSGDLFAEVNIEASADGVLLVDAQASEQANDASDEDRKTETATVVEDVPAPVEKTTGGGLWDVIDVSRTGYRIEEHVISSDDDVAGLRMQMPKERSMRALAMPKSLEDTLATGAEEEGDGHMAQRFVGRYCLREDIFLTEEERRLWLFLLFETNTSEQRQLGRSGFFDGLRLPGPAGTTRVRRLVAVDREKLGDAADRDTLAGEAKHRK